ncbi:conserved hypothetical protein [Kluyveromyces marxianus]|uniref:Dynactin subunit 4 n=1 Tax=Kluyveromyces marxianus (strain DMKU3-1042 / BCC 29191 / NBRC 104275) TaxID=1003335 RepID=W0TFE2_KLUMD|nr:uncharacterized protein KLMA_70252 [Kluyveromyces marxianus DMKU3-1042]BAO42100.1 conserved hypothetical protein [Kluyveromyces marxianus DMKU3-1042]BAP73515.1 conserved hypothetical protein [Kluyveromyces marxianus]
MVQFLYRSGCGCECSYMELSLCSKCHLSSCQECQGYEIIGKYCPQCEKDTSKKDAVYCHRNCFQCPRCNMSLKIISNKEESEAAPNKRSYSFKCQGCDWSYCTSKVEKVKSLTKYVMELESLTEYHKRFQSLLEFYQTKNSVSKLMAKQAAIDFQSLDRKGPDTWWKRIANGESLWKIMDEESPIQSETLMDDVDTFPRLCKLRPKYNYSCPYCKRSLTKLDPKADVLKWLKTSPAYNGIPRISVIFHPMLKQKYQQKFLLDDSTVLLHMENTRQEHNMTVKVNAEESLLVPDYEVKITSSNLKQSGSHKDHVKQLQGILRSMPTCLLDTSPDVDKLMRVENTRRLGQLNKAVTQPVEYLQIIDEGDGWVVIPLKIINRKCQYELNFLVHFDDWDMGITGTLYL